MRVYADFGPTRRVHSLYDELLDCPPSGVEFITHGLDAKRMPPWLHSTYQSVNRGLGGAFSQILEQAVSLNAPAADLVFQGCHLGFSKTRFVSDFEFAWSLLPPAAKAIPADKRLYDRNRPLVQRILAQDTCKALIAWNKKGKQSVLEAFDTPGSGLCLEERVHVVPLAMRIPKEHAPIQHEGFSIIFLGTGNLMGDWNFYYRGGVRMLRVFKRFCQGKEDVRLVLTGDVPKSEIWRAIGLPISMVGLLPKPELEHALRTSDALFYPSYTTPGLAFLEAKRYHVPVITTDSFANREVVDGSNGIVCGFDAFDPRGPYGTLPLQSDYVPFEKNGIDRALEDSLLEALERLYADRRLARSLGDNGFKEVSEGRFCIAKRNECLLRIFKDAIG